MQKILEKKTARIEVIDVLRGFTLLGIAFVHFTEQYYAGMPRQRTPTLPAMVWRTRSYPSSSKFLFRESFL